MPATTFKYRQWRPKILKLLVRHSRQEDLEFCRLVEQAEGSNDLNVARTLMQTFNESSETGVQQTVVRILGTIDIRLYYRAYLEALPRLAQEGKDWDFDLADYPERDPTQAELVEISEIAKHMPDENIDLFLDILGDEDFDGDHDWAEPLADLIES